MRVIYNVVRGRDIETSPGIRKTVWDRVGIMIVDGDRISIRLDAIPAGQWDGWLKAFPREDAPMQSPAPAPAPAPAYGAHYGAQAAPVARTLADEDVPF